MTSLKRTLMTPCGSVAFLALMVLLAMSPAVVVAQTADVITDPDVYAVYAAALRLSGSEDQATSGMALLQETRTGRLDCPRDESIEAEWRSVVESYRSENARSWAIEPGHDLGVPYAVITPAELQTLMQEAGHDVSTFSGHQSPGAEFFARFPGGRLVALSAVGFNRAKTRAMVTVQYNCLPSSEPGSEDALCHEGNQVMMEKEAGRWVRAKVGGCGWIARCCRGTALPVTAHGRARTRARRVP